MQKIFIFFYHSVIGVNNEILEERNNLYERFEAIWLSFIILYDKSLIAKHLVVYVCFCICDYMRFKIQTHNAIITLYIAKLF